MIELAEPRLFRFHPQGLQCDGTGLAVDGLALLRRQARPGGGSHWSPRPPEELEPALSRRFGVPVALATKRAGLDLVARCLTKGDLALAQIAALHLEFPDPPPLAKAALPPSLDLLRQLAASGLLARDWNPDDHPRTGTPPNPGWFAPKDDAGQEVAENDKEPPQTMTDESPEPAGQEPKAPEGAAAIEAEKLSAKEQARQIVGDLRQALKEVASEILQGGEIALWASELLLNRFDQSIEELKALLQLPLLLADEEQNLVSRRLAEAQAAEDPPKTLAELQTRPTENIQGYDLHHIVQQNKINIQKDDCSIIVEKFGRSKIDSSENLVWIPRLKHQLITGYYNTPVFTGKGYRLRREIVGDLDFEAQFQDGLATLQLFGVLQ